MPPNDVRTSASIAECRGLGSGSRGRFSSGTAATDFRFPTHLSATQSTHRLLSAGYLPWRAGPERRTVSVHRAVASLVVAMRLARACWRGMQMRVVRTRFSGVRRGRDECTVGARTAHLTVAPIDLASPFCFRLAACEPLKWL